MQAFVRNCRNQTLDAKGEATSGQNREARVPMPKVWDGPTCMSDEGPVMGLEQRGRIRWSY